jgi:hypothetical protein
MNSRFVPLTSAVLSTLLAYFLIIYFDGLWRWIIATPILFFVSWPSFKIGLFAPQSEVDKMTGQDKLEEPVNPFLLLIEIIYSSRYLIYALTMYVSFNGFPLYFIPLLALPNCLIKSLNPNRFNMIRDRKRGSGYYGVLKIYPYFYIQDLIIIGIFYGLGILGSTLF